ncbi:hypothetical protein DJ017_19435 [Phenylobacterium soli]|uniref:Uncharacterized protein n=1 Tax=Phenylobacterium soli TaxID=2170551 RepID=A0A328AEF0_9CAUL|nr:hypothetical protein DJ017_19435 [Phenylobacterium soli]
MLVFSAVTAAHAADPSPLTPADIRYLKTLGQSQAELVNMQPTAEMLDKLHQLINDPLTAQKPKARSDAVFRELDHISARSLWCADHPADKDCDGFKPVSTR